jgi:hypothetical protein
MTVENMGNISDLEHKLPDKIPFHLSYHPRKNNEFSESRYGKFFHIGNTFPLGSPGSLPKIHIKISHGHTRMCRG